MPKKNLPKKKQDKPRPKFDVHSDALKALWGVVGIVFFFLSILAFLGKGGNAGIALSDISERILGLGRFIIPLAFLGARYVLFTSYKRNSYLPLLVGIFLFFSGLLGILEITSPRGESYGGYWGAVAAVPFLKLFGEVGTAIVLFGFIIASFIIAFNMRIAKLIEEIKNKKSKIKDTEQDIREADGDKPEFKVKTWQEDTGKSQIPISNFQTNPKSQTPNSKEESIRREEKTEKGFEVQDNQQLAGDFRLPPIELLEKETGKPSSGDIVANANIIKRTLQNFGIEVEMGEVSVGPTVTQFTLKPAEGVKLSRIMALNNDLSLALAAHPIRIEAPIPGRSLVGIEIPNKGITVVRLKNLLESPEFQKRASPLTTSIGRDVTGAPVYANLAKMPHLLIAGSTGSGKTICLNVLILSLLYQSPPNLLKFILIDPKRVEFPVYSDIPHLLAPVVVDTQKTVNALKWAVSEMERRFEVLAQAKSRDILSFNSNKKAISEHGPLPYIVIVIDELADLMAARGKEIEALVVRLAQMARAVGIHLILATQRPSVEVITGLIKANITTRIAFQVASQVDSRTVLDMAGAEKLLGNGDMLYLSGDASKPRRVQGAYVTEKEIRRVADYLREEGEKLKSTDGEETETVNPLVSPLRPRSSSLANPLNPLASPASSALSQELGVRDLMLDFDELDGSASDDELYEEAKKLVIQAQKASASLLQRRLKVGYARAARLIDMLEENGIVGPGEGAKPREVYMGREEEGGEV